MSWNYNDISASYARCLASDGFLDTFYETFLSKSPEIPPLFASTDFVKQKHILSETIPHMLVFASGKQYAAEIMKRIAKVHSREERNIDPKLYPVWLDCLCDAMGKHDPSWSQTLDAEWREAMRSGIEFMISEY